MRTTCLGLLLFVVGSFPLQARAAETERAAAEATLEPGASTAAPEAPPVEEGEEGTPWKPTSSKAPRSPPPPPPGEPEQPSTTEQAPADDDASLATERRDTGGRLSARDKPFNRHGVGVRTGITVIPSWVLAQWAETHTNSLCRGKAIGTFARSKGLLKNEGCNFYVGAEYVYRQSRVLDIVGSIGYQRFHTPDGFWLDEQDSNAVGNPLSGADYTEINLDMLYLEADFIARAPVVVRDDVEWGIGGGAGVGLAVLFGGVYQTPIGSNPAGFSNGTRTDNTCQQRSDLADFRRCTPRWDPAEDRDGNPPDASELTTPNADLFATCSKNNCASRDLRAFGYREKNEKVPPVVPVVNLIVSTRVIVKDVFGITLSGGFNAGFYFGGSLTYFFGKQFQNVRGDGNTGAGRASAGPGARP